MAYISRIKKMKKVQQNIKIVAGNSNNPLAIKISNYLNTPLTKCNVKRFADMEVFVEILENVRGEDVFIIQSTSNIRYDLPY